jgi:hypothetical protein
MSAQTIGLCVSDVMRIITPETQVFTRTYCPFRASDWTDQHFKLSDLSGQEQELAGSPFGIFAARSHQIRKRCVW